MGACSRSTKSMKTPRQSLILAHKSPVRVHAWILLLSFFSKVSFSDFGPVCNSITVLLYGTYIFLSWMSSKLSGKDIQNSFANPTAFGESRESKIVRVDFPQI